MLSCLATAFCAGSTVASTAPVRLDRSHGLRFTLAGSVLTVGLVPANGKPPDARKRLWGKRIRGICSPSFSPQEPPRVVRTVALWPRGQEKLSFSFERDIAARATWCLLEGVSGVDVAGVDFGVFIRIWADRASDRRVGQELRRYLLRNAGSAPWLRRVAAIVVDRDVIAVSTLLRRNRRGKPIARQICRLIHGADVADFTPGHTDFGRNDVVIAAARRGPDSAGSDRIEDPATLLGVLVFADPVLLAQPFDRTQSLADVAVPHGRRICRGRLTPGWRWGDTGLEHRQAKAGANQERDRPREQAHGAQLVHGARLGIAGR